MNIAQSRFSHHDGLVYAACFIMIAVTAAHGLSAPPVDTWSLFGDRQYAATDLWTIQHFLAGTLLGAPLTWILAKWDPSALRSVVVYSSFVIIFGFSWEVAELLMEMGYFGPAFVAWKCGFEHWTNRSIADPLAVLAGALISRRYRKAWMLTLVPCAVWLRVNIHATDSMATQQRITGQKKQACLVSEVQF